MTAPAPAFVEVFGDDGELHPILIEDATDEELEDGIVVLESRVDKLGRQIEGLRELLRQRLGEPPSHYEQCVAALTALANMRAKS